MLGVDLVEPVPEVEDLARVDLDVRRRALESAGGLVDEDPAVGEREPLAVGPAGEDQGAHRHRDPDAGRLHIRLDELHRVVDREPRVDLTAG